MDNRLRQLLDKLKPLKPTDKSHKTKARLLLTFLQPKGDVGKCDSPFLFFTVFVFTVESISRQLPVPAFEFFLRQIYQFVP